MATNPQVPTNFYPVLTPPSETPGEELKKLIEQMEKNGDTLELIIMMLMTNPEGVGAMDMVSNSISGITEQSNVLSQVQSDIITLNAILSKIESQLGGQSKVGVKTISNMKSLLQQFQNTYKDLFVGNSANPNGESDLQALQAFESKFPTLKPVIAGIENWQKDDFDTKIPGGGTSTFNNDLLKWQGSFTSTTAFIQDIKQLAGDHYAANHPTSGGGKSSSTDYLQNWWTDGNADQQLTSGQSQQDTTQVQAYMQLLQGFDSSAQQDIQLASTQKSQMIQNEKTS